MADKTNINILRIRAWDEDIWRTIKGAKVLIDTDSGSIKGGMGGKMERQEVPARVRAQCEDREKGSVAVHPYQVYAL